MTALNHIQISSRNDSNHPLWKSQISRFISEKKVILTDLKNKQTKVTLPPGTKNGNWGQVNTLGAWDKKWNRTARKSDTMLRPCIKSLDLVWDSLISLWI